MEPHRRVPAVFLGLGLAVGAGVLTCAGPPPAPPIPSTGCARAWANPTAAALVNGLVVATNSREPVWGDYHLGDPWFVVHAGASAAGGACLGVWKAGRTVAYGELETAPVLGTPLYGFYVPDDAPGAVPGADQPHAVASWLDSVGVGRATIVPVEQELPVELSPLTRLQVALHEAFHAEVQAPHWAGRGRRGWPAWDRQPDRAGLRACYGVTDAVASLVGDEREALARTVAALLDGAPSSACRAGRAFLARREARYRLLEDTPVARHDSTPGTCAEAEAIMELEEGLADYASWTVLYALGLASRERLMKRYRAVQDDVFYLTGAMQLHAVSLMRPDGMAEVARRIGASTSPTDGSLTAVFAGALEAYCPRDP